MKTKLVPVVGGNGGLSAVFDQVRQVLGKRVHVLIEGESGTGKELVARALHEEDPARCHRRFVSVNCAAVPESLMEAELYGFRRGVFTGAQYDHDGLFRQAHGGTLFLDEVAELPSSLQPKLLRAVQEQAVRPLGSALELQVDIRIVSATNVDLSSAMRSGNFRPDLYFRLAEFPIRIPPLRERPQDIVPLAQHFVKVFCEEYGKGRLRIEPAALQRLIEYDWKQNNVRELINVVKRAVLQTEKSVIEPEDLTMPTPIQIQSTWRRDVASESMQAAVVQSKGNLAAAARMLGMSRSTLFDRLQRIESDGGQ